MFLLVKVDGQEFTLSGLNCQDGIAKTILKFGLNFGPITFVMIAGFLPIKEIIIEFSYYQKFCLSMITNLSVLMVAAISAF
jgi:hypothetical protein